MVFLVSMISVSALTVVSDETNEYYDGENWVNAVAAWIHPQWVINVNIPGATWIWSAYQVSVDEAVNGADYVFRKQFDVPECATNLVGTIHITTDNSYNLYLNDVWVGSSGNWQNVESYDISSLLSIGTNTIKVEATNAGLNGGTPTSNPGGLIYSAEISYDGCEGNDVPEFGLIGAALVVAGALGFIVFRKK